MTGCRKIPFITFVVKPYRKAKINLSGCNFDCKGCFAIAKQEIGRSLTVEQLIDLFIKSCEIIYGQMINDVQLTGGEPTVDIDYMLLLIKKFKELNISNIGISTNGYLLNHKVIHLLKSLGINYIKLDLKAFSNKIHKWYTGHSNSNILKAVELLNRYDFCFYTRTIFIPDIVDLNEIDKLAKFLSQINRNISYKLYQFATEYSANVHLKKSPKSKDMKNAFDIAKKYLNNVEYYTLKTVYDSDAEYIEVRADGLLDKFHKIDEISKSVINTWNMKYFSMSQILTLYNEKEK